MQIIISQFNSPHLHLCTLIIFYTVSFTLQQDEAALYRAVESGDVAAVRRLIEDHVNVNCTNEVCSRLLSV